MLTDPTTPPPGSGPTRSWILQHIRAAESAVTVRELADALGLHENGIRKHLRRLCDAGLVEEEVEHTGAPGRPRRAYRPQPEGVGRPGGWNPYELLATLLADVAEGRSARAVGRDYGRRLAHRSPVTDPVEALAAVTRGHGFRPTVTADGDVTHLALGECPFAAAVHPGGLVCDLHLGIAEGVVAEVAPSSPFVIGLEVAPPFAGGCRIRIHHENHRPSPTAAAQEAHA